MKRPTKRIFFSLSWTILVLCKILAEPSVSTPFVPAREFPEQLLGRKKKLRKPNPKRKQIYFIKINI